MAKRKVAKKAKRPVKRKKAVAKKAKPRKVAKKKTASKKRKAAPVDNRVAMWKAYYELQQKADKAWAKLRADAKRKAKPDVLLKDQNHLLLLLGECDYMARECMRMAEANKK